MPKPPWCITPFIKEPAWQRRGEGCERDLYQRILPEDTIHGSRKLRVVVIAGALPRILLTISVMPLVLFEIGCSQSQFAQSQTSNSTQSTTSTQPTLSVTIEPQSFGMRPGDSWNFTAVV